MAMFQSYHQEVNVSNKETLSIRLWCVDDNNKPALIRINDYYYSFYFKIPKELQTNEKLKETMNNLNYFLKPSKYHDEDYSPCVTELEKRKPWYFYTEDNQVFIKLGFYMKEAMIKAKTKLKTHGIRMKSCDNTVFKFDVMEDEVDPILKLFTDLKMRPAKWFNFDTNKFKVTDTDHKESLIDEYLVPWEEISQMDESIMGFKISKPWSMSYDIETYSPKDNEFPNEMKSECVCYMISCTFENLGDPTTRKYYCIYIGDDCKMKVGNVDVVSIPCDNESEVLINFFKLIEDENPIMLTGYNIGGFDNDYIDMRVNITHTRIKNPSLIIDTTKRFIQPLETKFWSSKSNSNLFTIPGRISIDMLDYMKRVYPNLDKHSLNFVSNKYLGDAKHDVTAKQMFKAYRDARSTHLRSLYLKCITQEDKDEFLEEIPYNEREWAKKDLTEDFMKDAKVQMQVVAEYCVQDTILPFDLMTKLKTWTAQIELSNLMYVCVERLLTEGEQVRCYNQLYNILHDKGYILIINKFPHMESNGGLVTDPLQGIQEDEVAMDFASLYPSLMRAHNISFETLINKEDIENGIINDGEYNTFNFHQMEIQLNEKGEKPNKNTKEAERLTKKVEYEYFVIKKNIRQGELPILMEYLLQERKALRKHISDYMKEYNSLDIFPEGHKQYNKEINERGDYLLLMCSVYEARQLAMKVSMNAIYGFLKVNKGGKMSFPHLAQIITAMGRNHLLECNKLLSKDLSKLLKHVKEEDICKELKKYDLLNILREGIIVYNDTDSVYCKFPWMESKDLYHFGMLLQHAFSFIFEKELILEFEQTLKICVHVTKKRYTGIVMDNNTGEMKIDKKTNRAVQYTRGLVTAKRSGMEYQRNILNDVSYNALHRYGHKHTLEIIFNYILILIRGNVKPESLTSMMKIGGDYASDTFMLAVFKENLEKRGRAVKTGEKVDFSMCIHEKNTKRLKENGRRDDSVKAGDVLWLIQEINDGSSPPIDYVLLLDKTATAVDQFFGCCYGNIDILSELGIKKNRGRTYFNMTTPMKFFSVLAYNTEEDIYRIKSDITRKELLSGIEEVFENYMEKILDNL